MDNSNFDFTEDTSKGATKPELQYDYTLDDNIVNDLVYYTRGNTVKNEEQFVLMMLGYTSGFMESPGHFVSGVLIGTAGSGKSHLQNKGERLIPDSFLYKATTGSDKSIIYDDAWDDAYIASLDELQKPSDEIIEILKSLHGGEDEEFRYKVTADGQGADRDVDEIVRSAVPYFFLYAQYEPDFEMWDRLIKIPVHESKEKNEGVARSQWDHSGINFGDTEYEYMYPTSDCEKALKDHIREIPKDAWVKIPSGEDEFGWNAFEHARPLFHIRRSETNRVSGQIANLVRSSALLNYKNRNVRKISVDDEEVKRAIIAEPQDVANILSARNTLLATTHQMDKKRKAICVALQEAGGMQDAAPINDIQKYLRKTNSSFVQRSEIKAMLEDLEDNYIVEKLENAGENGRNIYEFQSWQELGKFDINDEFKRVFGDCHDPFTGRNFIETARDINKNLTPTTSDFICDDIDVSSSSSSGGQATLGSKMSSTEVNIDLEPHEELVRKLLQETVDGETIDSLDEHEPTPMELMGIVEMGEEDDMGEIEGTIFDPEHEVWNYGPDEWADTRSEVESEIESAMKTLATEGIFKTSTIESRGGEPVKMEITVKDT